MKIELDIDEMIREGIDYHIESSLNFCLEKYVKRWLEEKYSQEIENILNSSSIEAMINRKIEERIKVILRDYFYRIQKM